MAERDVLELDRADPLAARLDHVLRAIGERDMALGVDHRPVAGLEEAPGVERVVGYEVGGRDPRSLHAQMPEGLAVARELLARVIDDLELDAENGAARFQ